MLKMSGKNLLHVLEEFAFAAGLILFNLGVIWILFFIFKP